MDVPHESMYICRYVTAFTTCVTGVGYMFAKDTFKIFNKKMGKWIIYNQIYYGVSVVQYLQ